MKKLLHSMIGLFLVTLLTMSTFGVAHAAEKPIELRWVTLMTIATLDPAQVQGNPMWAASVNLYDTLIFPDQEKGYIPWIAESWKASSDGLKHTFNIKKNVPFHDGSELTAEDVVFSMDRVLALKKSTIAPFFRYLKVGSTKALDSHTVEFNLTKRAPQFMVSLMLFKIVNKKVVIANKANGNYGEFGDYGVKYLLTHDAGSGPYNAVEHRIGNFFKMKRFEKYPFTQWKSNSIDFVTIPTIPEAVTEVTKLKAGELDMGEWTLPTESLKDLQKNPNFSVEEESPDGIWYLAMNNTKPPLDDVNVRRAVSHAFNTELATRKILAGGTPARGPLPENLRGGCTDITYYPYDLDKARALLKKSKYSADELKKFEMDMAAGVSERYTRMYLMFYSDLKKIGLNPKITMTTWPDMTKRQTNPKTAYGFSMITHVARMPHPTQILNFYTKEGWGKATPPGGMYYYNPKVTEALNKASTFAEIEEQRKYYCIAQKQIAEDVPAVFSHTDVRLFPMWRYVKGYKQPVGAEYFQFRFDRMTMDTDDPMFRKNHGW